MNKEDMFICRKMDKHSTEDDIIESHIVFEPRYIDLTGVDKGVMSRIKKGALLSHELVGVSWLSGEVGYVLRHRLTGNIDSMDIITAFESSRR